MCLCVCSVSQNSATISIGEVEEVTEEVHSRSHQIQGQIMQIAQDFYGDSLGRLKGQLQNDRAQLESLMEQSPPEAQAQLQKMIDSYTEIEDTLDQAAHDQGLDDAVSDAAQQAQDAAGQVTDRAGQAAQGVQDTAGQAAGQAQDAAGQAVGQVTETAGQAAQQAQDAAGQAAEQAQGAAGQVADQAGQVAQGAQDAAGQAAQQAQDTAGQDLNITDAARQKAEELGVDLSQVEGTGAEGRITVKDVTSAANQEERRREPHLANLVPTTTPYIRARYIQRDLSQALQEQFPEEQVLPQELQGVFQALVNSIGWSVYELISETGTDRAYRSSRLELSTYDSFDNQWMTRDEVVARIENTSGLPHNMADYALEFMKTLLHVHLQREDAVYVEHVGRIRSNDGAGFVIQPAEEHRLLVLTE